MHRVLLSIPVWGIALFIVMYIIAALLYPGGSALEPESTGFSFQNNYWCNLLNDPAINGLPNVGKYFAVAGMIFLSIALAVFWFSLPVFLHTSRLIAIVLRCSAIATCIFIGLLPGPWSHDLITNMASGAGLIAVTCTLIVLKKTGWHFLFIFGLMNVFLVALNNYFYHTIDLIRYLPLIQKLTFLSFIVWMIAINYRMKKGVHEGVRSRYSKIN